MGLSNPLVRQVTLLRIQFAIPDPFGVFAVTAGGTYFVSGANYMDLEEVTTAAKDLLFWSGNMQLPVIEVFWQDNKTGEKVTI